jgi:hypothetical protein
MTEASAASRRFQFSLRSLLIVTGILALLLVPVTWVARRRELERRAREEAIHSVLLEQQFRADRKKRELAAGRTVDRGGPDATGVVRPTLPISPDAAARIERLERENAELRNTVGVLRREVGRLQAR